MGLIKVLDDLVHVTRPEPGPFFPLRTSFIPLLVDPTRFNKHSSEGFCARTSCFSRFVKKGWSSALREAEQ